jgi:lysophospholipase L1-like esterase
MPVYFQALGTNYYQNQANGQTGSGAAPWVWEFDYYGADLALYFRNAIGSGSYFWIWVNGQPATAAPVASTANSANNAYWYRLTWGAAAQRRIRVYVAGADYGGIAVQPTDSLNATGKPSYSVALIGDSYTNGTGANNQLTSFPVTVGNMLNVEMYQCGIGGTGYAQGTTFGDSSRIQPLSTIKPNEIWFFGSINDGSYSSSQVVAAAQAAWAAAKAASPTSVIRVYGVQANSGSMSAGNTANNTALKAAALAAGFSFFDPINEGWITGTGHVGALTGSGNADIMIGSDGIHPTQAGHDYYARRIAADYVASLNAGI